MSRRAIHRLAAVSGAVLLWALAVDAAQAGDRFTFVAPNAPESTVDGKGPLQIVMHRWSDDTERDRLRAAITADGPSAVLGALNGTDAGYVRWPGGTNYPVRYARRTSRPDGGTDVLLLVDRQLWMWWDGAGVKPSTNYPFTLIQIRIGKDGTGEGRSSLTTTVRADQQAGIALTDEAQAAVVMRNVSAIRD